MTLYELMDDLEEFCALTPDQKFRVTAKIKRYVHSEKAGLCHRLWLYSRGPGIYEENPADPENPIRVGEEPPRDPFINTVLKEKYEGHAIWATLEDEKVVTWSVGSFVFSQKGVK